MVPLHEVFRVVAPMVQMLSSVGAVAPLNLGPTRSRSPFSLPNQLFSDLICGASKR